MITDPWWLNDTCIPFVYSYCVMALGPTLPVVALCNPAGWWCARVCVSCKRGLVPLWRFVEHCRTEEAYLAMNERTSAVLKATLYIIIVSDM
jgi:hypothetical protein